MGQLVSKCVIVQIIFRLCVNGYLVEIVTLPLSDSRDIHHLASSSKDNSHVWTKCQITPKMSLAWLCSSDKGWSSHPFLQCVSRDYMMLWFFSNFSPANIFAKVSCSRGSLPLLSDSRFHPRHLLPPPCRPQLHWRPLQRLSPLCPSPILPFGQGAIPITWQWPSILSRRASSHTAPGCRVKGWIVKGGGSKRLRRFFGGDLLLSPLHQGGRQVLGEGEGGDWDARHCLSFPSFSQRWRWQGWRPSSPNSQSTTFARWWHCSFC